MAGRYLDEDHRVIRQVPHRCQVRDVESGELLGMSYNAFTLDGHEYLSVAWPEYFDEDPTTQCMNAIAQLRIARSDKKSTAYWIARISDIRIAMDGHRFRAISEPDGQFTSHAALRNWAKDEGLLERLAAESLALAQVLLSKDIPTS